MIWKGAPLMPSVKSLKAQNSIQILGITPI